MVMLRKIKESNQYKDHKDKYKDKDKDKDKNKEKDNIDNNNIKDNCN